MLTVSEGRWGVGGAASAHAHTRQKSTGTARDAELPSSQPKRAKENQKEGGKGDMYQVCVYHEPLDSSSRVFEIHIVSSDCQT